MSYSNRRKRHGNFRDRPKPRSQRRKPKTPPEPAKRCLVKYIPKNCYMKYKRELKQLFVMDDYSFTEFPSKRKAQKAVWHTVQNSGVPGSHVDYRVEEL